MKKQTTRHFVVTLVMIFCVFYAFCHSAINVYAVDLVEAFKPTPRTLNLQNVKMDLKPLEETPTAKARAEIREKVSIAKTIVETKVYSETKSIIQTATFNNCETQVVVKKSDYVPGATWNGQVLTAVLGTIEGPSGKETYYDLPMGGVIKIMESNGYDYEYSVREDGVKLYGPYVMVAAHLDIYPRGSIVQTSLGTGIVCDTGEFAYMCQDECGYSENCRNKYQFDIAVDQEIFANNTNAGANTDSKSA